MALTVKQFRDFLHQKSRGDITQALNRIAIRKAARLEKYGKKNATQNLNVRSGRLRASITGSALMDRNNSIVLSLRAGGREHGVKYAGIHEHGGRDGTGIIKPKKGKFLTIPVHDSLTTGAGVARYASVRDVPVPLSFAQSRKGQPLLVNSETGEVFYLLLRQVKIKKRPYLKPAVNRVRRELGRELVPLIRGEVTHG